MTAEEICDIGRHKHRFSPPNRLYVEFNGILNETELIAHLASISTCTERCGKKLHTICNLQGLESITTEARQFTVRQERGFPHAKIAFVGGSFMVRTLVGTIIRAGRILYPQRFKFGTYFAKTVADAEAWIDEMK